jgi:hypothetical protein
MAQCRLCRPKRHTRFRKVRCKGHPESVHVQHTPAFVGFLNGLPLLFLRQLREYEISIQHNAQPLGNAQQGIAQVQRQRDRPFRALGFALCRIQPQGKPLPQVRR